MMDQHPIGRWGGDSNSADSRKFEPSKRKIEKKNGSIYREFELSKVKSVTNWPGERF